MEPVVLEMLRAHAVAVAARAYAPASRFSVGAALLAHDGRVFCGCNVENASYGLSICAERNALFHAIAEGARAFAAIAIYTPREPPSPPCGACRQVLSEFAPALPVALLGARGTVVETSLDRLLPEPFRFEAGSP